VNADGVLRNQVPAFILLGVHSACFLQVLNMMLANLKTYNRVPVYSVRYGLVFLPALILMLIFAPPAQAQDETYVHRLNQKHHCVLHGGKFTLAQARGVPKRRRSKQISPERLRIIPQARLARIANQLPRVRRRLRQATDPVIKERLRTRFRNMRQLDRLNQRCEAIDPPGIAVSCLPSSGSTFSVVRQSSRTISGTSCLQGYEINVVAQDTNKGSVSLPGGSSVQYFSHTDSIGAQNLVRLRICEPTTTGGLLQKCDNNYRLTFQNCGIILGSSDVSAYRGRINEIPLQATNTCSGQTFYNIVQQPAVGEASISGQKLLYRAPYDTPSSVAVKLQLCSYDEGGVAGCEAEGKSIHLGLNDAPEFSGHANSLIPYRQNLTQMERLHLLRRLGYGNPSYLSGAGQTLKLDDFLEQRLLNTLWHSEDAVSVLTQFRDNQTTFSSPSNIDPFILRVEADPGPGLQTLLFAPGEKFNTPAKIQRGIERLLAVSGRSYHQTLNRFYWGSEWSAGNLLLQSRYLSATESMMSHLWHGHFGTSGMSIGGHKQHWVGHYADTIKREALGNFRSLMVGSSATGCSSHEEKGGIICDALSNHFLDNQLNQSGGLNENFAREAMELYLLGPIDIISGMSNYTDINDVNAAASFFSGYTETNHNISYNPALHDSNPRSAFQEFSSHYPALPITNQSMTAREFVNHLLDHHPAAPRFIARRLFSMIVYPDPSDELVEELGVIFRQLDYDIYALMKIIARSEAMFSEKALYRECVMDPFRRLAETVNMLQLPLVSFSGPFGNQDGHLFRTLHRHKIDVARALDQAGERVMSYPDVFSHNYCGRTPGMDGSSEWLTGARILGRTRGTIDILRHSALKLGADFSLLHIRNLIVSNPFNGKQLGSVGDISVEEIIEFFSLIYNVKLSPEEHEAISRYITTNHNGVQLAWDPQNDTRFTQKTAGLIAIFSSLPQANIH